MRTQDGQVVRSNRAVARKPKGKQRDRGDGASLVDPIMPEAGCPDRPFEPGGRESRRGGDGARLVDLGPMPRSAGRSEHAEAGWSGGAVETGGREEERERGGG